MKDYTLEEIYFLVGKEDKTSTLIFKSDSESYQRFGKSITVVFLYTQKEREKMDDQIKIEPFSLSGFVKAKYLLSDLEEEKVILLKEKGVNSEDISQILYFNSPSSNTFHSKGKRSITKIEIPMRTLPKGRDLDWMYGFKEKLVSENIGLCPLERNFYIAGKFYYTPDKVTDSDRSEMFMGDGQLKEDFEYEYLSIKYKREEISGDELKRLGEIFQKKKKTWIATLDKYLIEAGSSNKKLAIDNPDQACIMYGKVMRFQERRINVVGKMPIYIDLDGYLHIYMRHVEEMKINSHFEHKDNFQWNEDDVFMVMEKIIQKINDEIQSFFESNTGQKYSRYGEQSVYFEGDYYTFHIDSNGRIIAFYKNRKEHEKSQS